MIGIHSLSKMTRLFLVTLLICLFSTSPLAQELKKKMKFSDGYQEEFTVLKKDKKVKHGQYIKFRINSFGEKAINTIGFFERNKKTGQWYFFSFRGYLKKEGKYSNDKKYGLWVEYYEPTINSLYSAFDINTGLSLSENGELIIDRSDLIKSSEGTYFENKKVGVWDYYAVDGTLLHKFDHDSLQLLYEVEVADSVAFPFLGGRSRFMKSFGSLENYGKSGYFKTFRIHIERDSPDVHYKANHPETDRTLKQIITKLDELDDEFIWDENNSLLFTLELIPNEGGMFGSFKIDFKNSNAGMH